MYDHPQTTPIIPQPLIYAACDSGRDRNLCDQHENNIRLTTELNEKVKKKRLPNEEASTLVPLATRCTLINIQRRVRHLHLRLPRPLFLPLFCSTVHSQISGLHEWTRRRGCMYSKLRGCESVCFSRHNEERAIPSVLLVSVRRRR